MQFQSECVVHAIKESVGEMEGRAYSSTTFHIEVDLKQNGAGRSIGHVTRPMKLGDHREFEKWLHLGNSLPIRAMGTFDLSAAKEEATSLTLVAIRPIVAEQKKAA